MAIDISRSGFSCSKLVADGFPLVQLFSHEGDRMEYKMVDDFRELHFSITRQGNRDFVLCDFQAGWRKPCKHYKSFDNAYCGLLALRRRYFWVDA